MSPLGFIFKVIDKLLGNSAINIHVGNEVSRILRILINLAFKQQDFLLRTFNHYIGSFVVYISCSDLLLFILIVIVLYVIEDVITITLLLFLLNEYKCAKSKLTVSSVLNILEHPSQLTLWSPF